MDLTLVTGFYDLNKFERRPPEKNKQNYMRWGEFLFKLDINLVFFVENEDYYYIWNKRKEYGLLHKTLVIGREFDKFKHYNIKDELEVYKNEHPILNSTPNKDSPNYIILTWNKIYMVEEIIKKNPFNTNYFGWIDFGIFNVIQNDVPENVLDTFKPMSEKIKILELKTIFDKDTENLYEYSKIHRNCIGGGLFTGQKNNFIQFIKLFKEQMYKFLSMRIFAHEETIIALLLQKHKELFDPYYGHYYQILINYKKINKPVDIIFENIKNCRYGKDYKNATKIASRIYNECFDKLTPSRKFIIYDELIVNGYYVDKKITEMYANKLIEDLENNPDLRIEFLKDKERNLNNLEFINKEFVEKIKKCI